jgi:hypothetical protein
MAVASSSIQWLISFLKKALNKVHVGISHNTIHTHVAFALGTFFGKNVTFKSFLESNYTGAGNFKALLGAAVGFNHWHYITVLSYSLLAFRTFGNLAEALLGMLQKKSSSFSGGKDGLYSGNCQTQMAKLETI